MRRDSEEMWSFETKNFRIVWSVSPCYDLDLSWDDTGETAENLASGLWTAFDSTVTVYFRGQEIAADYLGQSIYENPSEFRDHIGIKHHLPEGLPEGHRGACGSYFTDMVREAIREARGAMAKMKQPEPLPRMRTAA